STCPTFSTTATPPTATNTLSLHDALPISAAGRPLSARTQATMLNNAQRLERLVTQLLDLERIDVDRFPLKPEDGDLLALVRESRSEEHTSELQSRENLVCRLLLEKKKREI